MKKKLADIALGALERTGKRTLIRLVEEGVPGAVDGLLEDVEQVSEEVTRRTKRARGKIANRRRGR